MASKETLKLLQKSNIGYKCYIVPFKVILEKRNNKFVCNIECLLSKKRGNYLYYLVSIFNISVRLLYIGFGIWFEFTHNIPMLERVMFYNVGTCETGAVIVHVINLIFGKTIWELSRANVILMKRARKCSFRYFLLNVMSNVGRNFF